MKTVRKSIGILLVFVLCFFQIIPASAASYPTMYPEEFKVVVKQGETANLKFKIFREYKNEKYHVNIYRGSLSDILDGKAELVSTADGSVVSTSTMVDLTLTWDTKDVKPGVYTAEYYMSFYTFFESTLFFRNQIYFSSI